MMRTYIDQSDDDCQGERALLAGAMDAMDHLKGK